MYDLRKDRKKTEYEEVAKRFPKKRIVLPKEYMDIYDQHYLNSRLGRTSMTKKASKLEQWLHKMVLKTSDKNRSTLEIGAGTLNHLEYETVDIYDVIEPYHMLYEESKNKELVRNFFDDISEIPLNTKYERIISIACFEHILNLPEVISYCTRLLDVGGVLSISIPNEGRFLWHFAYTITTGREFKKRYDLNTRCG